MFGGGAEHGAVPKAVLQRRLAAKQRERHEMWGGPPGGGWGGQWGGPCGGGWGGQWGGPPGPQQYAPPGPPNLPKSYCPPWPSGPYEDPQRGTWTPASAGGSSPGSTRANNREPRQGPHAQGSARGRTHGRTQSRAESSSGSGSPLRPEKGDHQSVSTSFKTLGLSWQPNPRCTPKQFRCSLIVSCDRKRYQILTLMNLEDEAIDMLLFVLTGVAPNVRPANFGCTNNRQMRKRVGIL